MVPTTWLTEPSIVASTPPPEECSTWNDLGEWSFIGGQPAPSRHRHVAVLQAKLGLYGSQTAHDLIYSQGLTQSPLGVQRHKIAIFGHF